jgi:hypothetical protein
MSGKELQKLLFFIIIVVLMSAVFNLLAFLTNFATQWLVSACVGLVVSLVAGMLVEAIPEDILKRISLTVEVKGLNLSITAFALATFIVKVQLFGY